MQAVILAAGRGTRMGKLTENTPKPMLQVSGRPFLEYVFGSLPKEITEVIVVVGYLGDMIRDHFGHEYKGRKVQYVFQKEFLGTGAALWLTKSLIKGKFLVLNADDLYSTEDLKKCIAEKQALLVLEQNVLNAGGKVIMGDKGELIDVVESNGHGGKPGILNAGVYVLSPEIFHYELVKTQDKNEYGLPQTIIQESKDFPVTIVKATGRIAITKPEDIAEAEKALAH